MNRGNKISSDERVEVLLGARGDKDKTGSAVRRIELQVMARRALKSNQLTGSPTMADFNALQSDVAFIFEELVRISNLNGNADLPKV